MMRVETDYLNRHKLDDHLLENHISCRDKSGPESEFFAIPEHCATHGIFFYNAELAYMIGGEFKVVPNLVQEYLHHVKDESLNNLTIYRTLDKSHGLRTNVNLRRIYAHQILYMDMLGVCKGIDTQRAREIALENSSRGTLIDRINYQYLCEEGGIYDGFYGLLKLLDSELEEFSPGILNLDTLEQHYGKNQYRDFYRDEDEFEEEDHGIFGLDIRLGEYTLNIDDLPTLKRKFAAIRPLIIQIVEREIKNIKFSRDDFRRCFEEELTSELEEIKTTFREA